MVIKAILATSLNNVGLNNLAQYTHIHIGEVRSFICKFNMMQLYINFYYSLFLKFSPFYFRGEKSKSWLYNHIWIIKIKIILRLYNNLKKSHDSIF